MRPTALWFVAALASCGADATVGELSQEELTAPAPPPCAGRACLDLAHEMGVLPVMAPHPAVPCMRPACWGMVNWLGPAKVDAINAATDAGERARLEAALATELEARAER